MNNKKKILIGIVSAVLVIALVVTVIFSLKGCSGNENDTSNNTDFSGTWVQIYETTGTKSSLLERKNDLVLSKYDDGSMNISVSVDTTQSMQDFYGCGLAMTHASAYLLMNTTSELRAEILNELFGRNGAGLSVVRIPIGSSDYVETEEFFTCDDLDLSQDYNATDINLEKFSISHDENIIAVMKEVLAINPNITIMAAPWSAPAWMKSSKSLKGGELEDKYIDVYSKYLLKFVEAYKEEGITIHRLATVNEPLVNALGYPYMKMTGVQQAKIVESIAKLLKESNNTTLKIMAYEHNYNGENDIAAQTYIDAVLSGSAADYVSGVSFHAYSGDFKKTLEHGMSYVQKNYPGKEVYITEITEHSGSLDFALNMTYSANNIVISPVNYGNSMALYWNAVLTSDGKPVLGNNATCFGVLSLDKNQAGESYYTKNAAYYSMAHLSKFAYEIGGVYPKALKTESSNSSKINAASFKRADGAVIVVVQNINDSTYEDIDIVVDGNSIVQRIYPQSVVTFVIDKNNKDKYVDDSITNVEFITTALDSYSASLETSLGENAEFYFTITDNFVKETAFTVTSSYKDGKVFFDLTKDDVAKITKNTNDVFLWAKKDDKIACLPITFPSYRPYYEVNDKGFGIVYFGFDPKTSWSSYCDPAGKSVYSSNSLTWDDSAKLVYENLAITAESYTDRKFSEDKPYYYVTIAAKNGLCKFISLPLIQRKEVIDQASVLLSMVNNKAELSVNVDLLMDTEYELVIKTTGEEHIAKNISDVKGKGLFKFDPSVLAKKDVWYDIVIRQSIYGREYDLFTESNLNGTAICDGFIYSLPEWEGVIKINKSVHIDGNYQLNNVAVVVLDGQPQLLIEGALGTAEFVKLRINETDVFSTIKDGKFTITYNLSSLSEAGKWYDIHLYYSDNEYDDINTAIFNVDLVSRVIVNGKAYKFESWSDTLKVAFYEENNNDTSSEDSSEDVSGDTSEDTSEIPEPPTEFTVDEVKLVSENNKPYFIVSGKSNNNIVIKIGGNPVNTIINGNKYSIKYDLTSLTEEGKWYDVHIYHSETEYNDIDVSVISVDMTQSVETDKWIYKFESYENCLKVAYYKNEKEPEGEFNPETIDEILQYVKTSWEWTNADNGNAHSNGGWYPIIKISGRIPSVIDSIKLRISHDDAEIIKDIEIQSNRMGSVEFDLTELLQFTDYKDEWFWLEGVIVTGGVEYKAPVPLEVLFPDFTSSDKSGWVKHIGTYETENGEKIEFNFRFTSDPAFPYKFALITFGK